MSPERVDVWMATGHAPLLFGRDVSQEPTFRAFWAIARLRPEVTAARVHEKIGVMGDRLGELCPETSQGWDWGVRPLRETVIGEVRGPTRALVVSAMLLLMVVLANVVGLFVQRARQSLHGASVRIALGATRRTLRRTAVMLAMPETVIGLGLARIDIAAYDRWTPFPLPTFVEIGLDIRVIGASAMVVAATVGAVGFLTGRWWWTNAARARVGSSSAQTSKT